MTTFYLVRHGNNDVLGRNTIAGRRPGVHLNKEGRAQAERLAHRLAHKSIQHVFSSPLERARETAAPLAEKLGLPLGIVEALTEVDFGDWTGRTFAELDQLESWRQWNHFRSGGHIPNGELMVQVQARVVQAMDHLRREFKGQGIVLVSHGDPLRAAVAYYLGLPLDFLHRFELAPASVSILTITDWGPRLDSLNLPVGEAEPWEAPASR